MGNNDIVIINKKRKKNPPRKNKCHSLKPFEGNNSIKYKDNLTSNKKKIIKEKIKEILAYNEKELNELNFKSAIKYDKRNFIQIYYSFLKVALIKMNIK